MGRWRPPRPQSSPYITAAGYQRLDTELRTLWERRKEVTKAITAAAAEGDRSENAEYIYRKKQLREIDARIGFLQKRIPELKIVTQVGDQSKIYFGAWVTIKNKDGDENTYRIVGADEIDMQDAYISIDSPMGKALIGKTIEDEIQLNITQENQYFIVTKIRYCDD